MAKRKRAARIAQNSAQGFLSNPLLQQTQGVGSQALSSIASALGLGGGAGGVPGGAGAMGGFDAQAYLAAHPDVAQYYASRSPKDWAKYSDKSGQDLTDLNKFALYHAQTYNPGELSKYALSGSGAAGGANPQQSVLEQFMNSLGFQNQLKQGQRAVTGSAAAAGKLGSGATLKALTQFGQNLAQQGFHDYLNQLGSLAGAGQSAATNQASAQQQGGITASQAFLQPGALGKAFGAVTDILGGKKG